MPNIEPLNTGGWWKASTVTYDKPVTGYAINRTAKDPKDLLETHTVKDNQYKVRVDWISRSEQKPEPKMNPEIYECDTHLSSGYVADDKDKTLYRGDRNKTIYQYAKEQWTYDEKANPDDPVVIDHNRRRNLAVQERVEYNNYWAPRGYQWAPHVGFTHSRLYDL